MRRTVPKLTLVAATVAALVACGGDGGEDNGGSPTPPTTEAPEYSVTGNAVKGPMRSARVTAYQVTADGKQGDKLGEGTSGEGGKYSIKYRTRYTGPVLIEAEATDATEIEDEATGTTFKAPGLKLRAALQPPSASGGELKVQVNPLTETATAAATRSSGGLKVENIEKSNKDLVESLGFNPQTEEPTFDANKKPTNKAAVVMAAVSGLAKDGDIAACASKGTQGDKVKCVVEEVAKAPAGLVGVPALQTKIDKVAVEVKIDPPVIKVPEGSPVTEVTAVAQAKSLMNTLRSNAKALDASDLSLQTELAALEGEFNGSVNPIVDSNLEMLRTLDFGVELLEAAQAGSGVYQKNRVGTTWGAGCTLFTDDKDGAGNYTFRTQATSAATAKLVGCGSYTSINNNALDVSWTRTTTTWRWRHRLLVQPQAGAPQGTYQVQSAVRREYGTCTNLSGSCGTFTPTYNGTENQGKPVPFDQYPSYSVQMREKGDAVFTRVLTGGNVTALKLSGTTAPALVYRGIGKSVWIDDERGGKHEVALDVEKTEVNGVQTFTLVNDSFIKLFSNPSQGKPSYFVSSIGMGKGSFIAAPVDLDARDGTERFDIRIGFVAGNSAIRGQLAASDAKWDKSKTVYSPTKVVFGGRVERRTDGNSPWVDFLRGNIVMEAVDFANFASNQPRSANNPQKMKATTNAVVTIPNRPTLVIQDLVVSTTDAGTSNSATMSGQYRQGSVVINLKGTQGAAAKPIVTLESTTGIKLVVDDSKTVHPMTKSDVKVGEYNTVTGRLTYADGSFEQY